MELFEWLHRNKTSQRFLCQKLGISLNTMSTIVNDKRSPGLMLAIKIHIATNKEVEIQSLLSKKEKEKLLDFMKTENLTM